MLSNIRHISSGGNVSAILAMPTLDDFWITCATVSTPCGWASEMVAVPMVSRPGAVWIGVSKRNLPFSSASAAVNGFIVEPGSKVSVKARLRSCAPVSLTAVVRVVGRQIGQRQHFAALGVEHDDAAGLGLVLGDGLLEVREGQVLDLGVERQT